MVRKIVATIIVIGVFMLSGCGDSQDQSEQRAKARAQKVLEEQPAVVETGKTKQIQIRNVKYTLIDDYDKWVPVLYKKTDFAAIEKHITKLLSDKNETSSYELSNLYSVLARVESDDDIKTKLEVLNKWCRENRESHIPWLTRGSFYISYAWHVRGSGWAKDVDEDAWPKFRKLIRIAREDLEKSFKLNPEDPNSSSRLIIVARALSYTREEMEQHYKNGFASSPWDLELHYQKLEYLKPKWGGSTKEMFDFADECLKVSDKHSFLGFIKVFALEEAHYFIYEGRGYLGQDDVWATVEEIYTAFFAKYPRDVRRRLFYAYHAYTAKKYDIALEQFEIVGDRWMKNARWKDVESYSKARAYVYYRKGYDLLWNKKDHDASIKYLEKSIRYEPANHVHYAHYSLGMAYWRRGHNERDISLLEKAKASLEQALELKPDYKEAEKQLANLRKQLKILEQ